MPSKNNFSFLFNPSLPNRLKTGVLIAFLLMIITSVFSYQSFKSSVKEAEAVNHTYEVKLMLEEFFSSVKDVNRGISSILIRKDYSSYPIYRKGKEDMYIKYKQLKDLISDNPNQYNNINSLKRITDNRIKCLDSVLVTYFAHNEILLKEQLDRARNLMDSTEITVNAVRAHESYLMMERTTRSKDYVSQSKAIIVIFMVVAILIIAICFYLLLRSLNIIQEKEKIYRNIFEYSKDLLCICKSDFTIIEANPGFIKTFGFERESNKNTFPSHFFADPNDARVIRETIGKGVNVRQKELVFTGMQGEFHICLGSFILIDENQRIFSVVLTDITEQVQIQREREALERFANIGKVSRVLAHEVRNPLTNITLAVEVLTEENKDENLKNYFGIIERNSIRINKLITELLNSTRPTVLDYGKVEIENLLEEILMLAKDRINLQHIDIKKNIPENIPAITGDKDKLSIAFLNIIINAIEAMPKENGALSINVILNKSNTVAVSIKDNGTGMSNETVAGLFQPFFTNKTNGTGLGLASTQNIILTHKGRIEVDSELGKGTTFTVYLPLK